jgi:hypothetical protein
MECQLKESKDYVNSWQDSKLKTVENFEKFEKSIVYVFI